MIDGPRVEAPPYTESDGLTPSGPDFYWGRSVRVSFIGVPVR
jgi:hypothetical protein